MESLPMAGSNIGGERLQNMLKSLTKCKIDYLNEKAESKKLRDINIKMDLELKEARDIEKSNQYHLQSSREMIESLQETVSQLVYLKRDIKKLKDEIISKDVTIANIKKDNDNMQQRHNDNIGEMLKAHENYIEEITMRNEKKIQQVQYDLDTQVAQYTCVIEEMRAKIKDIEEEHRDKVILTDEFKTSISGRHLVFNPNIPEYVIDKLNKTNVVVLEYEEKLQRRTAEVSQLQEQLAMQTARTDANVDAYRRKLEDLEEKLNKNKFKEYLEQNKSQIENRVERPYSSNHDYTDSETSTASQNPRMGYSKQKPALQVMYDYTNLPKMEKKTHFNITKKRKLYSEKDFLNQ